MKDPPKKLNTKLTSSTYPHVITIYLMGLGVLLVHSEIGVTVVKVVEEVSRIERGFALAPIPHPQTEGSFV